MVETISIEGLQQKLHQLFCKENKTINKYASVWLTEADFGGLYKPNKFVLNVKAEHHIESCNDEIKHIVSRLFKNLDKEERTFIWRVVVYNVDEQVHCTSDDILVYSIDSQC